MLKDDIERCVLKEDDAQTNNKQHADKQTQTLKQANTQRNKQVSEQCYKSEGFTRRKPILSNILYARVYQKAICAMRRSQHDRCPHAVCFRIVSTWFSMK